MFSPFMVQVAIAALALFSIGGVVIALLYPRLGGATKSEKRLETITADHRRPVSDRVVSDDALRRRSVEATLSELEESQKAKARKNNRPTLTIRMRQAGLGWSKKTYYVFCAVLAVLVFAFIYTVVRLGPLPSAGFGLAGGLLLSHFFISWKRKRRFKNFSDEFPNAIDVIVRGVKAGLPLVDCLKVIAAEAQDPVASEFQEIVEDQTLGMPLDEAVGRLPERIPLPESNYFAIVVAIQSRTGGSLSEALSNLSRVLRDRKKMAAKIRAVSAEAKSSAAIIGSLPLIVAVLVYFTSPDYILLLFQTTVGNIVLAACAIWMGIGVLVMRKMINFDF